MEGKLVSIDKIKRHIVPILKKGGAQRAIVFGSYARGDVDRYSDLDLIVVADTVRPFVERFKDFAELWEVSPVRTLDVLVYTPEEFQQMLELENPFLARALKEGKLLYEARSKQGSRPLAPSSGERPKGG